MIKSRSRTIGSVMFIAPFTCPPIVFLNFDLSKKSNTFVFIVVSTVNDEKIMIVFIRSQQFFELIVENLLFANLFIVIDHTVFAEMVVIFECL
mgnify:CR=1 FL=1